MMLHYKSKNLKAHLLQIHHQEKIRRKIFVQVIDLMYQSSTHLLSKALRNEVRKEVKIVEIANHQISTFT